MSETHCGHGVPFYGPAQDCIECELIWYRGLLGSAQRNVARYQDKIASLEQEKEIVTDARDGAVAKRSVARSEHLSSERRRGLEEAAKWHDRRARDTPDAFEMEFHQVSAKAIRSLSPSSEGGEEKTDG